MFSNFFPPENRAVYEKMWKNIAKQGRPQMTIWRMRIAYWLLKATNTHSEYDVEASELRSDASTSANGSKYGSTSARCNYSLNVLLMMGEGITRNM